MTTLARDKNVKACSDWYIFSGDVASILAFALLARAAHRNDLPFTFIGWADTAWPFLTGLLTSWMAMHFTGWLPHKVAPAGVFVWLMSVVFGLSIWGIRHGAVPHWSFMIVAGSVSGALLMGYRAIGAKIWDKKAVEPIA